jgi:hypothetical protein
MSELMFELEFTRSYLNDPPAVSKDSAKNHWKGLEEVFTTLGSAEMKLNAMNIHVCCDKLEY